MVHMKRLTRLLTVFTGVLILAGCDDDLVVPDLNNPGLEELVTNPTRTLVLDAAQGLLIGARAGISGQTGYVAHLGILGRESYTFDNSDPRYVDEMIAGILDAGNGAFGGSGWTLRYRNIRNANILLNALETVAGFTDAEKRAIAGYAKTLQALEYLLVINLRDENGAAIDVDRGVNEPLAPIAGKAEVFAHIATLLNEAQADLQAGGGAFPFQLSPGFDGFADPASFARFNRALAARVAVYRDQYAEALTALSASFLNPAADLDLGVYYDFGTEPGDLTNGLFQATAPTMVAHPSLVADAQTGAGGARDARLESKTDPLSPAATAGPGLTSDLRFTIYTDLGSPIPIVRNEELILLRAEARWFTGDRAGALEDLNTVRTRSGGLAPLALPASDSQFVDALLYERRYSLLFEGGHRWIDARRFDRLDRLPLSRPSDLVPAAFPIPRDECIARGVQGVCGVGS